MATGNIKISQLPSLSTMTDSAEIPVVSGGTTYQITGANLQNYFGGNTGNVTFDDVNIIGTGNLKLQPDLANTDAYLDIYLTTGPDIHIAGNGENVIIGRDLGANVLVNANGAVSIQAISGNAYTWTFDTPGSLTLPTVLAGDTSIGTAFDSNPPGHTLSLKYNGGVGGGSGGELKFDDGTAAIKVVEDAGTTQTWEFGSDGGTIFPTLTTQRGDNPSGTITGQTLLFGDNTQEAVISTPNGNVDYINSQRLVINPGEGFESGEGGDIYLWAGRGGNTSGSGGDIKIRGGQGGTIGGGIGGAGGYIRMEAGNSTDAGAPGFVEITGGWGADSGQGGNITITTGDSNAVSGNVLIYSGVLGWTIGNDGKITLPHGASLNDTSGDSVAFGQNAGLTSQAQHAVAIGSSAGSLYQGEDSIAIGYQAGYQNQSRGVAIGYQAGYGGTLYRSVSDAQGGSGPVTTYFPAQAPNPSRLYVASTTNIETNQRVFGNNIQANTVVTAVYPGEDRVDITPNYTAAMSEGDPLTFVGLVIGVNDASNLVYPMRVTGTDIPANTFVQSAGCSVVTLNQYPTAPLANDASLVFTIGQGAYSTAVGYRAGQTFQADGAVAIGYSAGQQNQSIRAVAVGEFAGYSNQSANAVAVGDSAGEFTQAVNAVAVGYKAGYYQQGTRAVAIGEDAGYNVQGEDAVAIGQKAGQFSQGRFSVAIGNTAGTSGQGEQAVAIGYGAGLVSQQLSAVAIGANAASYAQGSTAVAIGHLAGNTSQGGAAVAVGVSAGYNNQQSDAVAIGGQSGYNYQSQYAVAIGSAAGQGQGYSAVYQSGTGTEITITPNAYIQIGQRITGEYVPADTYVVDIDGASLTLSQAITGTPAVDTVWTAWGQQGISAVAIGQNSGLDFQGNNAVAIGTDSGSSNQSANAVAIGYRAGFEAQGSNTVSIGTLAGQSAQGNNSIILNATGAAINSTGANTFTVAPVRNDVANTGQVMFYNTTSKEITYGNVISVAGNITGGNLDAVNLVINNIRSDDSSFVTIEDGVNVNGTISATGNVTANNVSLIGNGFLSFTSGSTLTFGDTPVTNRYYVDATRIDTYTQNGSQARPFKTIAAAQAAIATAIAGGLNPEVEPIYIILLSNITENVTLATNHVYLVGQNGQIHQPIILTGNIIVQPTSGTLNNNHFSISGMEIVGGTNGKAIYVTGTFPTRLSLQDVWITANGNSGAGLYQDNTGTGTYTHGGPIKVSHNGTGDVYCFDIRKGTASFDTVETSGATQVGAAGPGATLTFNNSQLDANGDVVVETYGNGVLVVTNSVIKNSAANSYGIKLNAVANVAGTVSVGQSAFNVPLGTGQAVWLDPNTTPGLSGVFAWSGASFYPGTNTTINPSIIPAPLAILAGTIANPILYGDITSYSVAQDWDLIDNNASALSFDTTGKAGVLELVTTNSAEGVKMSGFASVVGNITGGNLNAAGLSLSGNVVSALNASSSIAAGTTISAVGNITGGNILGGANVNATTHTGTTVSVSGNITGGNLAITGNTATVTSANYQIGYLEIPQISFAANATANLTVSGKHYYSTSASNLALTIANNTSVVWPVGTAISIVNRGTANITVAGDTGVSLYLAGNSTAGNRVVTTYGMATVMNVAANVWMISGTVV